MHFHDDSQARRCNSTQNVSETKYCSTRAENWKKSSNNVGKLEINKGMYIKMPHHVDKAFLSKKCFLGALHSVLHGVGLRFLSSPKHEGFDHWN